MSCAAASVATLISATLNSSCPPCAAVSSGVHSVGVGVGVVTYRAPCPQCRRSSVSPPARSIRAPSRRLIGGDHERGGLFLPVGETLGSICQRLRTFEE